MPDRATPEKPPVTLQEGDPTQRSKVERIKAASEGLLLVSDGRRDPHSFRSEIDALTRGDQPTIGNEAKELSKFFGVYKQQARGARGKKTDDYFFMVRIKNPAGGELSRKQWLALDDASDAYGDGTLRVTSRQGLQYHHVYGPALAPLIRHLNRGYRDHGTLGACGDVNRNVMASPIDGLDAEHDPRGRELAHEIAELLAPRTGAYFEIWLTDAEGRRQHSVNTDEPIYGTHYLPRKFKIGIAHPTDNSVDLLTHDIGLMPVRTRGRADGNAFDLYSGGGLGMTHNMPHTQPLLGLYLGRIRRDHVLEACRGIVMLQNENGERGDRRRARWKYTIRRLGVEAVKDELKRRFHLEIEEAQPEPIPPMRLHLGWHEQRGGGGYYGVSVENGRVAGPLRTAIRAAVEELDLAVRLTPQQDVLLCNVSDRGALERILDRHDVPRAEALSGVRRNAMACPAKPTCGLAMTDAENILPRYLDALEAAGLGGVDAVIRMTGCPNNCARPPTAEVGIYGYGKNDHVILVGGSREGTRLAKVLFTRVPEQQMIPVLVGLFAAIRDHNRDGLPVGEFLHRTAPETLREWIGVAEAAS
jgi:sulfite reductase (ferredoxin)